MTWGERKLFKEVVGKSKILLVYKTGSHIDVGHWFGGGIVWVCAAADELALFAAGRRGYSERVPFRLLRESLYNHVTGELALAPATELGVRTLKMTPAEGYQLLAQIYREADSDA
jgi:hypothetical protein